MGNIEQYYNQDYDEWGRLLRHRIEFEMTKRMFDRFIPEKASVLDVGGEPGRYGICLAQKGHEVQLQEEDFQSWLDVFEALSLNPEVWGSCEYLLYIGRKGDL